MDASRNTSPFWCVACARSLLHVHVPSGSAGSDPLPSGTTRVASAASQSASGFLQRAEQKKGMKGKVTAEKKQHENSLCHFKMCADGIKEWMRSPFLNKRTVFHLIGSFIQYGNNTKLWFGIQILLKRNYFNCDITD